jgi:hypothetical protein
MKKRLLSLLLVVLMLVSLTACGGGNDTGVVEQGQDTAKDQSTDTADDKTNEEDEEGKEETKNREPYGELIVGNTTELSGGLDFHISRTMQLNMTFSS